MGNSRINLDYSEEELHKFFDLALPPDCIRFQQQASQDDWICEKAITMVDIEFKRHPKHEKR